MPPGAHRTLRRMATDLNRRGKVTEENREESRKLKAIWEREKARLLLDGHGTQEAFGQEFGIGNQAAVGFFLNGKSALSPKAAAAFARGLRCSVSDFSPRLAKVLAVPADRDGIADRQSRELLAMFERLDAPQRAALLDVASAMLPRAADAGAQQTTPRCLSMAAIYRMPNRRRQQVITAADEPRGRVIAFPLRRC